MKFVEFAYTALIVQHNLSDVEITMIVSKHLRANTNIMNKNNNDVTQYEFHLDAIWWVGLANYDASFSSSFLLRIWRCAYVFDRGLVKLI